MTKTVSPLVAECVRFSAEVLRRKTAEVERITQGAESDAKALRALSVCLLQDGLLEFAQDMLPMVADGGRPDQQVIADALVDLWEESEPLRALLADHAVAAAE